MKTGYKLIQLSFRVSLFSENFDLGMSASVLNTFTLPYKRLKLKA